ncbi:hypothetical protein [Pseudomonas sp. R1-6]|uniref:hypothetical protein n=1 Tax=Pseudomonas sp. R1-6 TaxID=2817397 RepID=UPI003DA955C3
MKMRKTTNTNLVDVQNLVRGALAKLKEPSTPERARDAGKQAQYCQKQINKAISMAKAKLSQNLLNEFFEWLALQLGATGAVQSSLGVELSSIGIFPAEIDSLDLASEIDTALSKIARFAEKLEAFADVACKISSAIRDSDWVNAATYLEDFESTEGVSYWSLETGLALLQKTDGLEPMKTRSAELSVSAYGLTRFYLYFFGVRNEPAQNSARYRSNTTRRVDDADLSEALRVYSKYRLHGNLGSSDQDMRLILAAEQFTTPIDLLFTLIKACKKILCNQKNYTLAVRNRAAGALDALSPILCRLNISPAGDENSEKINSKTAEHAKSAIQISFGAEPATPLSLFDDIFARGLASQISSQNNDLHAEELAKFCMNYSWISECIEVGDLVSLPTLPKIFESCISPISSPPSTMSFALQREAKYLMQNHDKLGAKLQQIYDALYTDVKPEISRIHNRLIQDCVGVIASNRYFASGDHATAVEICAKLGIYNPKIITALPIVDMYYGYKWSTVKRSGELLHVAITLDHLLKIVDERTYKTYKRYAIEDLMKAYSCKTIIDLPQRLLESDHSIELIAHLCASTCNLVTIELLPGMTSSKKSRQTRSDLLKALAKLKPPMEELYIQEAIHIEDSLHVDDGLEVLDDSKVYVDEQSIMNALSAEVSADFQRYKKLVESGVGESEDLQEVIKSFRSPSAKNFQVPKNEADDLLGELVGSIREKFLWHPVSGLDVLIGRRIRHGTIASELRGVLEPVELICQRPKPGADYQLSARLDALAAKLDPKRRKILKAAFSRFSESIDSVIGVLRDEYFYVKSKNKPRGVFDLVIPTSFLMLLRAVAQACSSADQFLKECIGMFWYDITGRCEIARPAIDNEIKKNLQSAFSKLTNELRSNGIDDVELLSSIVHQSEELHRRASVIASWIRVPNVELDESYTLKYIVDVAVAFVSGQHTKFNPKIDASVPEDLFLDLHGFSIIQDALYLALVNIYEHSGVKTGNQVSIKVDLDTSNSLLHFTITNDIAENTITPEKEAKLNSLRQDIKKRAYGERAKQNRDSGISKLATIVMQYKDTNISFDFEGKNLFRLEFQLLYLGSPPSRAAEPASREASKIIEVEHSA